MTGVEREIQDAQRAAAAREASYAPLPFGPVAKVLTRDSVVRTGVTQPVDPTDAAINLDLPPAKEEAIGECVLVINTTSSTNNIVFRAAHTDLVNGAATLTRGAARSVTLLQCYEPGSWQVLI